MTELKQCKKCAQLVKLLQDTGIAVDMEFKIEDKQYNLHIVGTNMLIDVNPTNTHNAIGNHRKPNGLASNYHINKTNIATAEGYRVIHVWDWDDIDKIVQLLKKKTKIYARNCELKQVSKAEYQDFTSKYHLQGPTKGFSLCLGLYYNDMLVEIMSWGKPRFNKNYEYELLRLCSHSDYKIVGGTEKLFKHSIDTLHPISVISYCDLSKFSGEVYHRLGMERLRINSPQKVWSQGNERVLSTTLRQLGYDKLFDSNYGKGASNEQLMIKCGWLPVYDCGQAVFVWRNNQKVDESAAAQPTIEECKKIAKTSKKAKTKICAFCGKEFLPKSNFQKYCKGPHIRICPVCGKEYEETNSDNLKRPPHACSYDCRAKKTRQTSIERYGCVAPGNNEEARKKAKATMQERFGVDYAMQSETVRKKSVATNIEKYGVENPQQNKLIKQKTAETNLERYGGTGFQSEELLNKYKDTMIDMYGVTSPIQNQKIRQDITNTMTDRHGVPWFSQSEEYKDKCTATSLDKYGAEHWMQTEECKQKCRDTWLRNYGVDNPSKSPQVIAKIKQTFIDKYGTDGLLNVSEIREKIQKTCMERYGVPYGIFTPQARKHNGAVSKQNKQVMKLLDDAGLSYQSEFNIENKSFDIKILYSDILIEIDPSYTHSIELNHWNTSVSDTYHIEKTLLANKHGYQCYHIFDWDDRKKFVKSLTKKHDVEIEQYYISEVDELTATNFYFKYSIYMPDTKYAIHIGIFSKKNNSLLQVSSFRFIDISSCRWLLCANSVKFQINVTNGLQNIIDYFVKYYDPAEIVGLCDLAKSNGMMFESAGFKELAIEPPRLIWSRYRSAISNDNVKNQTKFNDEQIYSMMINNKYLPVYDCGYKVYSLKLK